VREILLVVRAQNLGSGVLRNLAGDFNNLDKAAKKTAQSQMQTGSALMAVGTGVAAVGAAGLLFLGKAASAAVDYNRQVALTKTQTYGLKVTMDQLSQAGLDVARNIAVPLDQIQSGLYDIFSSMDVNLTQARFLLSNFAKEAVAGQVDLSTAERATIGIMNSYQMKVSDVTKVQDIMFNLVKFGVGTYADFASVIGRVTGPAVRANQTFEQTAALMAFVTRNGLSAANGAASVGRALDAIGKSRDKIANLGKTVIDALGPSVASKLGFTASTMIKVTDASGKLLPVNQIMTDLGTSLGKLNPTQLNDVLNAMFKGTGGTIQAMRFFDIAIKNYGQLNKLVKDMGNSKGALKAAYDTMAQTPAMKIQQLKNNFQAFMIVLGQTLLPIIGKVASALADFFSMIGKLPKPVIAVIAIVIAVTSVLLVLGGIIMVVVGAWLVFSAVLAATEVALAPILITIGLVIAAVVALAIAAYLIYKHWQPISTWFHNMWFDMWRWIDHIWQLIFKSINDTWKRVMGVFRAIETWITGNFDKWWKTHGEAVKQIWNSIWDPIASHYKAFWDVVVGLTKVGLNLIEVSIRVATAEFEFVFRTAWDIIVGIFRVAWAIIVAAFKIWWAVVSAVVKIGWEGIRAIFKIAWDTIVFLFNLFLDVLTGHWHTAFVDMENYAKQIWNTIRNYLVAVWHIIENAAVPIWNALRNGWFNVWHAIYNTTQQVWHNIENFLSSVWRGIETGARNTVGALKQIWHGIEAIFRDPVNFVIQYVYNDGLKALWNGVMNAIGLGRLDLPNLKTMATGGRIPGFGGGDRVPAMLERGEAIVDKNRARKYGWLLGMIGVPGFQAGGLVHGIVSGISSATHKVVGGAADILHVGGAVAKMTLAAATGNQTAFTNAMISALPGGAGGAAGNLATMITTLPLAIAHKIISSLWNTIAGTGGGAASYRPGAGVQQWRTTVLRALAMEGLSTSLVNAVLYQMQTESGGNPRAINLWDINAQRGDPSKGLMQVIGSTFAAFHWPGTSFDIFNPLANIAAALSYARTAYGPNLRNAAGGIGTGHGYAGGSWYVPRTEPALVHEGEMVLDRRTASRVRAGAGVGPTQVFYISTQEIDPRRHAAELGWELARRSS